MTYRCYRIVKERWQGDVIIWVETPDGPFDAIIEEATELSETERG